jgi:Flp pilus assembly protein TadB
MPAHGLDAGAVLAAVVGAGLACALVLLVAGIRGTVPAARVDAGAPPGRIQRAVGSLRSPMVSVRAATAAGVGLLVLLATRWPVAAAGLAALTMAWPQLFGGARAEQAQITRLEALASWTESLRDTVSAHSSLEQAIPVTAATSPPVIRAALIRLTGRIRARTPVEAALTELAVELDDASADLVIAALILNVRRRGDRLADVLSGLAATAREELDLRRRISAGRAGVRRGVHIVVGMTLAFAAFLTVFGGDYVRPYDSVVGQIALTVVIGMFAAGFGWMRRLSGTDAAQPFLSRPGHHATPADLHVVAALTAPTHSADLAGRRPPAGVP